MKNKNKIKLMKSLDEKEMKDDIYPLVVRTDIFKHLIDYTINCHWHQDVEYGILLSGTVDLYINDTHIELQKGDGFFIGSNILHMSKQSGNDDAIIYRLTFSTNLFSSVIYTKYVEPILNMRIEGFKISDEELFGRDVKTLLMKIYELEQSAFGYELKCLEYLNRLWLVTLRYIENNKISLFCGTSNIQHTERMKKILSYIHQHYNEKITALDIAEYANISRGECFRCFKYFMNKKLVEYINEYRIQKATKLLRETEMTVIDISTECGFENASYFGKMFKEAYSLTPLQYSKAYIWTSNTVSNINGYDYEYWKDSGDGKMIITSKANNGSFTCEWRNVNNIIFRSGKKFYNYDKTHNQIGNISLQYDADYNSTYKSYLCIYGWTVAPLVEWYIVEHWATHKLMLNATCLGTFDTDDGTYELYRNTRVEKPSIIGTATFGQYWSIRTSCRLNGTVNVSAHFNAWENIGMKLGHLAEVSLTIESLQSNGNAAILTNILSIGRIKYPYDL